MEQKLAQLQAKIEADGSLGEKLFSLETAEEVQGFLCEVELKVSREQSQMCRDVLVKILEKSNDGELSDEDLEEVAGGSLLIAAVGVLCLFLCGFCVGSIATQAGLRW